MASNALREVLGANDGTRVHRLAAIGAERSRPATSKHIAVIVA